MKTVWFVTLLITAPFITLFGQEWHTDIASAKHNAVSKNMAIILVFQGSDWCAPCIKLNREIWNTEEFKSYAKDHFVMLLADFPKKKKNALPEELQKKNNQLAEKYNPQGIFPFVAILDSNGSVLGNTGYKKMTPKEYINHLESFIH